MLPEGRRLADLASAYHQHHFALFEHTANRWLYFAFYIQEMASLPRGHVLTLRQFGQIWNCVPKYYSHSTVTAGLFEM